LLPQRAAWTQVALVWLKYCPRLLNIHHKNPPDIVALTPLAPDSDHKAPPVIGAEPVALRRASPSLISG
jgi:hypothetical protein